MKKLILILMLLPIFSYSQDFKKLIKEYESYCNEKVLDTILQHGTITETLEAVGNGYYQIKLDTTWNKPNCPEFRIEKKLGFAYAYPNGTNSLYTLSAVGNIIGTEVAEPKRRNVTRDYVCECKRREVEPFSEDFWNWIKQ